MIRHRVSSLLCAPLAADPLHYEAALCYGHFDGNHVGHVDHVGHQCHTFVAVRDRVCVENYITLVQLLVSSELSMLLPSELFAAAVYRHVGMHVVFDADGLVASAEANLLVVLKPSMNFRRAPQVCVLIKCLPQIE